jgi:hypothetical protein
MAISIYDSESDLSVQDIQKDIDEDGMYRGGRDTPYSYVETPSHYLNCPEISEHGN